MFSIPFEVCESIVIDGSLTEVFSKVSNFSEWKHWSPWLCQNANASVSITGEKSEIGHQQVWDGEWIGSGEMKISYIHPSQFIDYDLVFLKPWKSKAQARFEFLKTDQGIKVSWKLQSKLPIFLFFLKKMMIALIASDYTRGLVMLKQFVEKGEIAAETKVLGTQELPAFHFVGQRQACTCLLYTSPSPRDS